MDTPLVSISCITYNHAPYIRECLNGFLMQKTNFPFEVLIHDDCSTDGTTEIIKQYVEKYPNIIKPLYEEENQYQQGKPSGSAVWNLPRAKGKYVALCEGDDYWTDPMKLQKQVDFLESHPDYGMCYAKVQHYNQKDKKVIDVWGGPNETFKSLYVKNTIPTLTVLFRTLLYSDYLKNVKPLTRNWKMGDYPIWLYVAAKSKIKFLDEVTGVYRILPESASHSKSIEKTYKFRTNFFLIGEEMASLLNYPLSQQDEESHNREKYFQVLPLALLLSDEKLIEEAKIFFRINKKSLRECLLLNLRGVMRVILKMRYHKRGFRLS